MPEEIEVPTEHLHEKMEEEAEHRGGWIAKVAVSSALLAVAAAISALLAGHHANEAMLEQMKATDQWAYYQAKGIKSSLVAAADAQIIASGRAAPADDNARIQRYDDEQKEIEGKGHELEQSSEDHMAHHKAFAIAVTLFQIAIAMGAISVLAKKPPLWFLSLGLGAAGLVFLVQGLL
ncbi:MAG: DUF4337 domain-containing protein [Acidobacteriota bacterium]